MYSSKKSETDRPDLWHFGVLFQGIIIAFTVFLGRVYVLSYFEALGIPAHEAQLSAIDYAIVSPSITVLGIGLSIVVGCYFLALQPLARLQLPTWYRFGFGLFLSVLGPVVSFVILRIEDDSVMRSLWIVLSAAMSLYGGVMLGPALSAIAKRDDVGPEENLAERRASYKLLLGVVAVVLVVVYGVLAYTFSYTIASDEASDALRQSPRATVQFESGDSGSFRVIVIGEQYVYLLPEGSEELQAFPHSSIAKIDHVGQ